MKKICLILILVSTMSLFEGLSQNITVPDYVPGEVIVKFEPGVLEVEKLKGDVKGNKYIGTNVNIVLKKYC